MAAVKKVLIVFVPGIMGSRLYIPSYSTYWDPDSKRRMVLWASASVDRKMEWLDMQSPADVVRRNNHLRPNEIGRGWGGVWWKGYGGLLRYLSGLTFSHATCQVCCVGYDWRQSNCDSGKYLLAEVDQYIQQEHADEIVLITHSMGGLVVRSALKESSKLESMARAVIHLAQPVQGAVVFYRRFFTGANKRLDGGFCFARILGDTSAKFTAIVSGVLGAFELLPTRDYTQTGGQGWVFYNSGGSTQQWPGAASATQTSSINVYDWYRGSMIPPGLPDSNFASNLQSTLRNQVSEAEAFHHSWLGNYKHPNTWAIYSTAETTDTAIIFDLMAGSPSNDYGTNPQRPPLGDQTVPEFSAGALFPGQRRSPPLDPTSSDRQYQVNAVSHIDICLDGTVQSLLGDILVHAM
jgi:Lecithin:cholesterol acyltransferase